MATEEVSRKVGTKAKAKFKKGQKVMVLYQEVSSGEPIYYAAEVKRSNKRPNAKGIPAHHYEVHFPGWGVKHDAWVEESEVTRFDKTLHAVALEGVGIPATEFCLAPTGTLPAAAAALGVSEDSQKKRKFVLEPSQDVIPALRVKMPALLKKVIVDDFENIMQLGLVLPLPRSDHKRPSVRSVLQEFMKDRVVDFQDKETLDGGGSSHPSASLDLQGRLEEDGDGSDDFLEGVVAGMEEYFEKAVLQCLLYGPELPMVHAALGRSFLFDPGDHDKAACDVFGAEHLVRLLVQLPRLVPVLGYMETGDLLFLESKIHELMTFMSKNQATFFSVREEYIQNPHAPKNLNVLSHSGPLARMAPREGSDKAHTKTE